MDGTARQMRFCFCLRLAAPGLRVHGLNLCPTYVLMVDDPYSCLSSSAIFKKIVQLNLRVHVPVVRKNQTIHSPRVYVCFVREFYHSTLSLSLSLSLSLPPY